MFQILLLVEVAWNCLKQNYHIFMHVFWWIPLLHSVGMFRIEIKSPNWAKVQRTSHH